MNLGAKTIRPVDLQKLLAEGRCCLVDVREPVEYAEECIPAARSIPLAQLGDAAKALDPNTSVVVMCLGGKRGEHARAQLEGLGFSNVRNLEGGLLAWKEVGLPVTCNKPTVLPLMRQVQLVVGILCCSGAVLALTVHPHFAIIPAIFGAGLAMAGATGWCGLAILLSKMPWNRRKTCQVEAAQTPSV